jgi:hypothetical protein
MEVKKYKFIIAQDYYTFYKYKLKVGLSLEELQVQIGDAFAKGILSVRLYKNGRKKKDFIEIKKEDYSPEFNEECYRKCKFEADKKKIQNRIDHLKGDILYSQKLLNEKEEELTKLENESKN